MFLEGAVSFSAADIYHHDLGSHSPALQDVILTVITMLNTIPLYNFVVVRKQFSRS